MVSPSSRVKEPLKIIPQHIILRTSWVFGLNGKNFVKTMLQVARTKTQVDVVSDQIGGPTSARALADVISLLVCNLCRADFEDERWGTYRF